MELTRDFNEFSPRAYLEEYYTTLYNGNDNLLRFLHETYEAIVPGARMLEIGGGPTVYQLISASRRVSSIVFAEYLESNRREVHDWLEGVADRFDWSPFFAYVAELEGATPTPDSLAQMEARLRAVTEQIIPCDVFLDDPFFSRLTAPFDIVASNFCLESVCDNESDFLQTLVKITKTLRPGGLVVLSLLNKADYYTVGDRAFRAFSVDEGQVRRYLTQLGCQSIWTLTGPSEAGHGDQGMIFVRARMPETV